MCDHSFLGFGCKEWQYNARCPECLGWFCKKHDTHECFSTKLDAQLQKQINVARSRRNDARDLLVGGLGGVTGILYGLLHMDWVIARALDWVMLVVVVIWGAITIPSFFVNLHYGRRLHRLGVKRSIRPQTTKKDH